MASSTFENTSSRLTEYTPPTNVVYSQYTNIMFVDSVVAVTDFISYCNADTYPLVYDMNTTRSSITQFISNFNNIKRIAFAFHGQNVYYAPKIFINNDVFFDRTELGAIDETTDNYLFVKGLIQQFSLENMDF